jgi:hypothetical protein
VFFFAAGLRAAGAFAFVTFSAIPIAPEWNSGQRTPILLRIRKSGNREKGWKGALIE